MQVYFKTEAMSTNLTLILTSVLILITSLIYMIFPPRKINGIYGYRTNRSMKNQTNWIAANKLASFIFVIGSGILVVQRMVFLVFFPHSLKLNALSFIATLLIVAILTIVITEKQLKKLLKNQ